jgi:tRNA A37 methylthiotransferase MiaB
VSGEGAEHPLAPLVVQIEEEHVAREAVEEVRFDSSFSFVYSRRPGTPAASLPDETPQPEKLKRLQRLQHLSLSTFIMALPILIF